VAVLTALNPSALRGDVLVPLSMAARRVGRTSDTLKAWADKFGIPVVKDPGGDWLAYQSWIDAVLASALPGRAGSITDVTSAWWRARGIEMEGAAA
jgi:hypothetical protein